MKVQVFFFPRKGILVVEVAHLSHNKVAIKSSCIKKIFVWTTSNFTRHLPEQVLSLSFHYDCLFNFSFIINMVHFNALVNQFN